MTDAGMKELYGVETTLETLSVMDSDVTAKAIAAVQDEAAGLQD